MLQRRLGRVDNHWGAAMTGTAGREGDHSKDCSHWGAMERNAAVGRVERVLWGVVVEWSWRTDRKRVENMIGRLECSGWRLLDGDQCLGPRRP